VYDDVTRWVGRVVKQITAVRELSADHRLSKWTLNDRAASARGHSFMR